MAEKTTQANLGFEKQLWDAAYGFSALQSRVMSMQTVEHSVTLEDIRDIVDEAIYYASRKTLSSLVDSLSRRKGGTQNRIILRDKDFLHY